MKKKSEIVEELRLANQMNEAMLIKIEQLKIELDMERNFHGHTIEEWMKTIREVESKNGDIEIFKLMLGLDSNKKPL